MTVEQPAAARTLAEAAAVVWPAPARVEVLRKRPTTAPDEWALTYALVPDAVDPRLAVPLRPWAAAAAVARSQSAAGSARAAARNGLVAAAFRTGVAGLLLRGRLVVTQAEGASDGLDDVLADLLGEPVCLGIRVGPPRANRKPVLQVVSRRGRLLAYAKVGTGRLTDRLVRAESQTLTALAGADLGEVRVPAVLHVGAWHGHPLLVQAPLPVRRCGRTGRAAARRRDGRGRAHRRRSRRRAVPRPPGGSGPPPRWPLCRPATRPSAWRPSVTCWPRAPPACRLAVGAWHGDWNAGNCSVVPGAVLVWDWERYETGVPAGFDALHLALQSRLPGPATAPGADGVQARAAAARSVLAQAAGLTAPFGVADDAAELVAAAYLWGSASRYLTDDQEAAGAAVGRLADWLLPVLEQWGARTGGSVADGALTVEGR